MVGDKSFTGNLPRAGKQRSAKQVADRLNNLLNNINEIFGLSNDTENFGNVIAFDATGEITAVDAVTFTGTPTVGQILISDGAGGFTIANSVTGSDKNYVVGPDGSNGQILNTDGSGNIGFQDPPASTVFIDQAGNFTAGNNINYNIDAGAQITIDNADVVANGFTFRVRPKYNVDFESSNPVILYNGINAFENITEDLNLNANAVYTVYSQNGTNLQISVEGISENI